MKRVLSLCSLFLLLSGTCEAMKISEYLAKKDIPQQKALVDIYLKGYIHGLFHSNDVLEARGEQLLFCMPDQESFLRRGNYTEFLDSILSKTATYVTDDTTIEIAVLSTLVNTYPCKPVSTGKKKK